MKSMLMRIPNVQDLYTQRVSHDIHRKKLERIRQQRKSHLGHDNGRVSQIESLKESKNRSFIHRFNKTNDAINKENVAFLGRLQRVRPSFSRYSQGEKDERRSSQSFVSPFAKKRINETEQENLRISNRMRSMSSSLNAEKLDKQYQRTQQIKKRLMRYIANENNQVSLKTEKYLDIRSNHGDTSKNSESHSVRDKRNLVSHYNAEEITKNKVESGNTLLRIKKKYNSRPNTTTDQIKAPDSSFFTTEPEKHTKNKKRHVYL